MFHLTFKRTLCLFKKVVCVCVCKGKDVEGWTGVVHVSSDLVMQLESVSVGWLTEDHKFRK